MNDSIEAFIEAKLKSVEMKRRDERGKFWEIKIL